MGKILKNTLVLVLITCCAGLGLGFVYGITKERIKMEKEKAKKTSWQAVFPEAGMDEFKPIDSKQDIAEKVVSELGVKATVDEVCEVGDKGYIVTVTDKEGYGGDIQITVGITTDGTVSGISILSISETAGLGMKAKEPAFYEQYHGKNTEKFVVSKDGGDGEPIDALSGATITSRAVTAAVNTALGYHKSVFGR